MSTLACYRYSILVVLGAPRRAFGGKMAYVNKHVTDRIYWELDIPGAALDDITLTHTPGLKVSVRSRIH